MGSIPMEAFQGFKKQAKKYWGLYLSRPFKGSQDLTIPMEAFQGFTRSHQCQRSCRYTVSKPNTLFLFEALYGIGPAQLSHLFKYCISVCMLKKKKKKEIGRFSM